MSIDKMGHGGQIEPGKFKELLDDISIPADKSSSPPDKLSFLDKIDKVLQDIRNFFRSDWKKANDKQLDQMHHKVVQLNSTAKYFLENAEFKGKNAKYEVVLKQLKTVEKELDGLLDQIGTLSYQDKTTKVKKALGSRTEKKLDKVSSDLMKLKKNLSLVDRGIQAYQEKVASAAEKIALEEANEALEEADNAERATRGVNLFKTAGKMALLIGGFLGGMALKNWKSSGDSQEYLPVEGGNATWSHPTYANITPIATGREPAYVTHHVTQFQAVPIDSWTPSVGNLPLETQQPFEAMPANLPIPAKLLKAAEKLPHAKDPITEKSDKGIKHVQKALNEVAENLSKAPNPAAAKEPDRHTQPTPVQELATAISDNLKQHAEDKGLPPEEAAQMKKEVIQELRNQELSKLANEYGREAWRPKLNLYYRALGTVIVVGTVVAVFVDKILSKVRSKHPGTIDKDPGAKVRYKQPGTKIEEDVIEEDFEEDVIEEDLEEEEVDTGSEVDSGEGPFSPTQKKSTAPAKQSAASSSSSTSKTKQKKEEGKTVEVRLLDAEIRHKETRLKTLQAELTQFRHNPQVHANEIALKEADIAALEGEIGRLETQQKQLTKTIPKKPVLKAERSKAESEIYPDEETHQELLLRHKIRTLEDRIMDIGFIDKGSHDPESQNKAKQLETAGKELESLKQKLKNILKKS